jgi:prepilin peptidase CpaA
MTTYDYGLFLAKFLIPFAFACAASVTDLRARRIPNAISVALLVSGLSFHLCTGLWHGLLTSIAGFAVGFCVLLVLYLIGGGGAGDVKFMGGVGAWVGPYHILFVFVISAVLVAIFAFLVIVIRMMGGPLRESKGNTQQSGVTGDEEPQTNERTKIPYAVPVAFAIVFRLVWLIFIQRAS